MSDERVAPVVDEAIAVVVGLFNPAIVQPSWLARQGLVSAADADAAEISLVHPTVTSFRCGPLVVQVDQTRLEVHGTNADALPLVRDLTAGVVTVLEHTPVRACGINRHVHLPGDWDALARRLVNASVGAGIVEAAEPRSVTLRGRRTEGAGALTLTVEPSEALSGGVYFGYNEHYERPEAESAVAFVRRTLDTHWEAAQRHFHDRAKALLLEIGREHP